MKSQNIYNAPNPKDKNRAFNSEAGTFADSAKEISRESRNASEERVAALIAQTKKSLDECC